MIKSKFAPTVFGRVRVIEGWRGFRRLYVKRTNLRTYVVSFNPTLSMDSMVDVAGEYHFSTLEQLHKALNAQPMD